MEYIEKMMRFPIFNISILEWNDEVVDELTFENEFYHSNDELFFDSYVLRHNYVDCNGVVYRVIGKVPINSLLWRLFLQRKFKVYFEKTDERISVDDLRSFLMERIRELAWNEKIKDNWIGKLKEAKTIKELLNGK